MGYSIILHLKKNTQILLSKTDELTHLNQEVLDQTVVEIISKRGEQMNTPEISQPGVVVEVLTEVTVAEIENFFRRFVTAAHRKLGHIDRRITILINSGITKNVAGIVIGRYTDCENATDPTGNTKCTEIDVLRDWFGQLGMPIGTRATLDADAGTLAVAAGVR